MKKIIYIMCIILLFNVKINVYAQSGMEKEVTLRVTPVEVSTIDKDNKIKIIYDIDLDVMENAPVAAVQFELVVPEGMEIGADSSEIIYNKSLIYDIYEDKGIFTNYMYNSESYIFLAVSSEPQSRILREDANLIRLTATVDANKKKEYVLSAKNFIAAEDGSGEFYEPTVVTQEIDVNKQVGNIQTEENTVSGNQVTDIQALKEEHEINNENKSEIEKFNNENDILDSSKETIKGKIIVGLNNGLEDVKILKSKYGLIIIIVSIVVLFLLLFYKGKRRKRKHR